MGSALDYGKHTSPQGKNDYTYSDYLTWNDDIRRELIHGRAWAMSPAPVRYHQELLMEFSRQLANFLKGKPCKVYPAPFDVRLPREGPGRKDENKASRSKNNIDTVVQPDISVVCDPKKLDDAGCIGAPDLVIEIVSRGSAARDQVEKLQLYEEHRVREYWIVHPADRLIRIYRLGPEGKFARDESYAAGELAQSVVLEGFTIPVDELFGPEEPGPPGGGPEGGPDSVAE